MGIYNLLFDVLDEKFNKLHYGWRALDIQGLNIFQNAI